MTGRLAVVIDHDHTIDHAIAIERHEDIAPVEHERSIGPLHREAHDLTLNGMEDEMANAPEPFARFLRMFDTHSHQLLRCMNVSHNPSMRDKALLRAPYH